MKELINRLISSTPPFFQRMQARGAALVGYKAIIMSIAGVPVAINMFATKLAIVGAVIILISQCACDNPKQL